MPVAIKKHEGTYSWALWKIDEEENYFYEKIKFTEYDSSELSGISHEAKRLEWLASRYLIRFMMDKPGIIHLNKKANGKPFIENYEEHISISHTQGYAAVIHSKDHPVSVDAEAIDSRVLSIEKKFIHPLEQAFIDPHNRPEHLIACWSMKETIFKLLEIPGLLFFKEIIIQPFSLHENKVLVQVSHPQVNRTFEVHFRRIHDVFVTWCIA